LGRYMTLTLETSMIFRGDNIVSYLKIKGSLSKEKLFYDPDRPFMYIESDDLEAATLAAEGGPTEQPESPDAGLAADLAKTTKDALAEDDKKQKEKANDEPDANNYQPGIIYQLNDGPDGLTPTNVYKNAKTGKIDTIRIHTYPSRSDTTAGK